LGYKNDMKARFQILAMICLMAHTALGDSPPHGKERLRELAVFPSFQLSVSYEIKSAWDDMWIGGAQELAVEIRGIRGALKREPGDIDGILHLAYLSGLNNQTDDERSGNQDAERLCRRRLETTPENGWSLAQLGRALDHLGKNNEAESVLRRSVLVSSNDWRCHAILGNFLEASSCAALMPPESRNTSGPQRNQIEMMLDYKPSPEAHARCEELHREAARYMNQAVALGQSDPELWLARARFSRQSGQRDFLFRRQYDATQPNSAIAFLAAPNKDLISDLRKASELKPKDFKLIYLPAGLEWSRAMLEMQATGKTTLEASGIITDAARKSAREAMTRLENLYPQLDRTNEAAALEAHGMLKMILDAGNIKDGSSLVDFRRVIALDPLREQSWDVLMGGSAQFASSGEVEELCEARLKANDTARNHLLFAKQFIREKKWDRAKEQVESAVKLEPENVIGRIMTVALIIRQAPSENLQELTRPHFELLKKLLAKMPDGDEKEAHSHDSSLNLIIVTAIANYPKSNDEMRTFLDNILRHDPNDEGAKAIRAALD